MKEEYTRVCKNCKKQLTYSCYQSWYLSQKNKSLCRTCAIGVRMLNYPIGIKIKHLYDQGLTNKEISQKIGGNRGRIRYWLKKWNVKPNGYLRHSLEIIDEAHARCSKCNQVKDINQFLFNRKGQKYEYRFTYCLGCRRIQQKNNINSSVEIALANRFCQTRRRAIKNNIPFIITRDEFIQQFYRQKGLCFYSNELMSVRAGDGRKNNSFSVDKIVPEKGYVLGNVVFCASRINTIKHNLSLEELREWIPRWYNKVIKFTDNFNTRSSNR